MNNRNENAIESFKMALKNTKKIEKEMTMKNSNQQFMNFTCIRQSKNVLREKIANDISSFLENGGTVTVVSEKKRRRVYRNPCERSPMTLNRISVDRVNRVAQIKNLFPSSIDSSIRFAVERGWKRHSRRRFRVAKESG